MEENKKDENVEETKETAQQETENKDSKKEGSWFKNTWDTIYNKLGFKNLLIISYSALGVIILALIISVSVVGVKHGDLKNQSSNSTFSAKDEKSFNKWKKGVMSSFNYDGEYTLDETADSKTYKGDTLIDNDNATVKAMILPNGQYAYSMKLTSNGTAADSEYEVIKNDNGVYKFAGNEQESSKSYYAVDSQYYKEAATYIMDFNTDDFGEVYVCASASSLDEIENIARITSIYTLGVSISNFECSIESKKGAISLNVKYLVQDIDSDYFEDTIYDITIDVSKGHISKIVYTTTLTEDMIDDSESDTKVINSKVYNYTYSSDITFLNSLIDGKNDFSGKEMKKYDASVRYYVEGGLLGEISNYNNEPVNPYFSGYTWYLDKECTKQYNNEPVVTGGLDLYGKLNAQTDGKAHFIMLKNHHYIYPDNYAELLKEEDNVRADVLSSNVSDTSDFINDEFEDYNVKITMNGKEYSVKELSEYTFEANKIYTLSYTVNANPFYA